MRGGGTMGGCVFRVRGTTRRAEGECRFHDGVARDVEFGVWLWGFLHVGFEVMVSVSWM